MLSRACTLPGPTARCRAHERESIHISGVNSLLTASAPAESCFCSPLLGESVLWLQLLWYSKVTVTAGGPTLDGAVHGHSVHRYSPTARARTTTHAGLDLPPAPVYVVFHTRLSPAGFLQCMDPPSAQPFVSLMRQSSPRRPSLTPLR